MSTYYNQDWYSLLSYSSQIILPLIRLALISTVAFRNSENIRYSDWKWLEYKPVGLI